MEIIKWDIYEISSERTPLVGAMFRGRVRKIFLQNNKNVLVENASDVEGVVRFAVPSGEGFSFLIEYFNKVIPDAKVEKVAENIPNPVLSKLKVNIEERYTI